MRIFSVPSTSLFSALALSLISIGLSAQEIDSHLREALNQAVTRADSFVDRYDAEVWLLPRSAWLELYVEDPQERLRLLTAIHAEATQSGLNPDLVLAVIEVESGFDQYAVSKAGAQGLMQVMPFWKNELGREEDNLTNMETNLRYGCAILSYYLDRENGEIAPALARYNGSYGQNWYSDRVLNAQAKWR